MPGRTKLYQVCAVLFAFELCELGGARTLEEGGRRGRDVAGFRGCGCATKPSRCPITCTFCTKCSKKTPPPTTTCTTPRCLRTRPTSTHCPCQTDCTFQDVTCHRMATPDSWTMPPITFKPQIDTANSEKNLSKRSKFKITITHSNDNNTVDPIIHMRQEAGIYVSDDDLLDKLSSECTKTTKCGKTKKTKCTKPMKTKCTKPCKTKATKTCKTKCTRRATKCSTRVPPRVMEPPRRTTPCYRPPFVCTAGRTSTTVCAATTAPTTSLCTTKPTTCSTSVTTNSTPTLATTTATKMSTCTSTTPCPSTSDEPGTESEGTEATEPSETTPATDRSTHRSTESTETTEIPEKTTSSTAKCTSNTAKPLSTTPKSSANGGTSTSEENAEPENEDTTEEDGEEEEEDDEVEKLINSIFRTVPYKNSLEIDLQEMQL